MHCYALSTGNRHFAEKFFRKAQANHEKNIKNARSRLDRSPPLLRSHDAQRTRPNQAKEQELARIEQENQRLITKIQKSEASVDSHNRRVPLSLNTQNRKRQQLQHETDFERLQKRVHEVRATYPAQEYAKDYAKTQVIQKRLRRFPPEQK